MRVIDLYTTKVLSLTCLVEAHWDDELVAPWPRVVVVSICSQRISSVICDTTMTRIVDHHSITSIAQIGKVITFHLNVVAIRHFV